MDLQPLIEQIVYSDDPVTEFSKVAANLDDRWKVTLAREVNKGLFQRKLQETPLNENIEFDVVEVPQMHKIASEENYQGSFEKRASHNPTQKKITPDMFMFHEIDTMPKKASSYTDDGLLKEAIAEDVKRELETQKYLTEQEEKRLAQAQRFFIEQEKDLTLKKIASELPDMEHLKTFVKIAIKEGLEKEAEKVMEYYDPDLHYFTKTASATLTLEEQTRYKDYINALKELNKTAEINWDKVRRIGGAIGGFGLKALNRAEEMVAKTPGTLAKGLHKTVRFARNHPFLTAAGIAGGVAIKKSTDATDDTLLGR